MTQQIKNLAFTLREQWKGSGNIHLWFILFTTLIFYIIFTYMNTNVLGLIFDTIIYDFQNKEEYIRQLEILKISEIIIIAPIVTTTVLLISTTINLKNRSLCRTLPIAPIHQLIAIIITIISITAISYLAIYVLNEMLSYYIQNKYMPILIQLQESNGDLYKKLHSDYLLSNSFNNRWHETRSIVIVFMLSITINTLFIVLSLWTKKYAIPKGLTFLIVITVLATKISTLIRSQNHDNQITIDTGNPFMYIASFLLPLLLLSLYYLLKEREQ